MSKCHASRKDYNALSSLKLQSFRNHASFSLEVETPFVVITGPNGSGKTNILEAISLLGPGRGLRSVAIEKMDQVATTIIPWGISAQLMLSGEEYHIGTAHDGQGKRRIKIDHEPIKNQSELLNYLRVIWLTPQMDGLFIGPSSERRRFFDRVASQFFPEHQSEIYRYEYHMRERIRLLRDQGDPLWIEVLEQKMAATAVAITATRLETLKRLQQAIDDEQSELFPKAALAWEGATEKKMLTAKALEVEEWFAGQLKSQRQQDGQKGKTHFGVHKSDVKTIFKAKKMPAELCSTGEQKSLLLSITIAQARSHSLWHNRAPILLFDEVAAHLDEVRKKALFEEVKGLKTQLWLTGTDKKDFADLKNDATCVDTGG